MAYPDNYSPNPGATPQGISINSNRRIFNFGDRVSELAPQQSPFFVYLSKVAKKATDDPVFKFLEQRHQWQRRNFKVVEAFDPGAEVVGTALDGTDDLHIGQYYDEFGNISSTSHSVKSIVPGCMIAVANNDGSVRRFQVSESATVEANSNAAASDGLYISHDDNFGGAGVGMTEITGEALTPVGDAIAADEAFALGNLGQVIGSAHSEGSGAPKGWEDSLYDREGYCQIFKTAMNLFSGTAMATRYRGIADEYKRVWTEKLMEHKMDLEQAFLFGSGSASGTELANVTAGPTRYTHGIVPYTESNGKVYNMSYASSGYDAFLDAMEDFFAPESGNSGNKLVLASRKVITYLNKLGAGSFMNNSVGSSQYRLDVQSVPGNFGHSVTMVNTIYGNLHFVAEPLLRGPWENYAVCVDMANVAYRPLVGNGISRDTFIETNIQGNDEDGRKDQVITEAGLEISLPETHAILKFS